MYVGKRGFHKLIASVKPELNKPYFISAHSLISRYNWILRRFHVKCTNSYNARRKYTTEVNVDNDNKSNDKNITNKSSDASSEIVQNITSVSIFGSKLSENSIKEINENSRKLKIPSVTVVLRETMSLKARAALKMWKENMINQMGKEQFDIYSKELLSNGRLFHACIENTLLQKEVEVPTQLEFAYSSIKPVLNDIESVEKLETYVTHPQLRYRGIVDCIASYRDKLCVIDWKKSDKLKATLASTYDAPLQLAAYIGAVNASDDYPFTIDRGLVVVGYTSGEPASIFEIKDDLLDHFWQEWLKRLAQFYNTQDTNKN